MKYLNNRNKNLLIAARSATTTISVLAIAIMLVSTSMPAPVSGTTTTASGGITTSTSSGPPPSEIRLSPQPIYEESSPPGNITPINETHGVFTFSGNGMLTLPNSTQTINTTHNGTAFISFATSSGYGRETIRTQDGETITARVYEIVQSNPTTPDVGKGIVTAIFQTNSTTVLASLNGMILAGIDDMSTGGASHVTLWKWESGNVSSSNNTSASSISGTGNNSIGVSDSTTSSATI